VKISRPAADSDGSLTDEILMLGRPEPEADEPTVVPALHAPRRRIIFAAAAAVALAGCATLAGSLSATGSKSPRSVPQAAPQAPAPNPAPAPPKPTQAGPSKIRPAPRHEPAPTRPPVQVAVTGVLHGHGQPVTTRRTNTPPKQQPTTTDTHPNHAGGMSALSQDAPPNLDMARARIRQVSLIIADLSRQADGISRIIGLPRSTE
jgi:hypothetical protein